MKTSSKSFLNVLTVGCTLAVLLFHSAGSERGDTEENQQNNITGTWNLSIRYTGGDVRSINALKRVSGPAKGKDMSLSVAATNNGGEWITAHFISFRVTDPPPGNLTFTLKQEGAKVTGTFSGLGGHQKVSGTVRGEKVSFSAAVTNNVGEQITARFEGEVLSSSKMEGAVTIDQKFFQGGPGPARSKGEFAK